MMPFSGPATLMADPLSWTGTVSLVSAGLLAMGFSDIASGIAERLSEDDAEEPAGNDDPFGGAGDEFGGGQFGEDGFADDRVDEDDLGGLDDWDEGDEFDGLDGAGGGSAAVEPRIEELEDEVANISSTVSTVRSENQAINESVEEIEDNVRQLLDIYEMVTRGVNPFVDDVAGGGMEGSFGLFDDDGDQEFDDVDPEVADADAESFFEDDFGDEPDDAPDEDPFAGGEDPLEEGNDPFLDDPESHEATETEQISDTEGEEPSGTEDAGGEEGKTFEELKSEYESADVDWQGDGESSEVESGADSATADDGRAPSDGAADAESSAGGDGSVASTDGGDDETGGGSGKPYLRRLPDGYATELLVIEWLSYLRSRSSTSEAVRAIRYYETIDWIGTEAASALQDYLAGLSDGRVDGGQPEGTQLTIDHHTHSLRYISRLGGTDVEVERLDWPNPPRGEARLERGEQRGIQR